jgi:hypothetical protein
MRASRPLLAALFLVALCAAPAYSYRREYVVTLDGARKPGSEVCFYRAVDAHDPFHLFFSYDTVQCLPADRILDIPSGMFHAFARHRDGYVSKYRDYFAHKGEPYPDRGYEKLEIPLERAGVVDLTPIAKTMKEGQSLGVWLAPTPSTPGTFFPLVDGETSVFVPADTPVIPLLVADHRPIAAGDVLYLHEGEREIVREYSRTPTAIAWLHVDRDSTQRVHSLLPAPDIALQPEAGEALKPLIPIYDPMDASNTLVFFKGAAPGAAHLHITGRFWLDPNRATTISSTPVHVETAPLELTAGGSLTISWKTPERAPETHDKCEAMPPKQSQPLIVATLLQCPQTGDCTAVLRRRAAYDAGSLTFPGVPDRVNRITMQPPLAPATSAPVDIEVGRERSIDLPIQAVSFFGKVSRGGRPIRARLVFETGAAVSDEDGRYTASLAALPLTNLIRVIACDDGHVFTFVPRQAPVANAPYDIDLKIGSLSARVVSDDGAPVAGADVHYSPVKETTPRGTAVFYSSVSKKTDSDGRVAFDDAPIAENVTVCAAHPDYPPQCTEAIPPERYTTAETLVRLRHAGLSGRVAGHSGAGIIACVDQDGRITEQTRVGDDGKFSFQKKHQTPEYLVYSSAALGLAAISIDPSSAQKELLVAPPAAPKKTFAVSVPTMTAADGLIGLWIGNAYIPLQILATHEELRGQDVIVHRGRPLILQDILASAPISVAFAEFPSGDFVDVFTLPEYAGVARHVVHGNEIVLGTRH